MGCDWYSIKSIQAIGFFTDEITEEMLEILNNPESNFMCYTIAKYTGKGGKDEQVVVTYFIYHVPSLIKNSISIPGPYEIVTTDYRQKIKKLDRKVDDIKNPFEDNELSHWNMLTSLGIQKGIKDKENFLRYHGYNGLY